MATQSLVVSRDPEILGIINSLMSEIDMAVEVVSELPKAIQSLKNRRYDALIVDCDQDKDGFELLMKLREEEQNQKLLAVGITSDVAANQAVFDSGATFVLNKPLPVEDARRILKITNGVITRAVRRFMRLPVDSLAIVSVDDRQEGIVLNISQKGLAVQTTDQLNVGQIVYVSFLLPDTFNLIEGAMNVAWVDASGRAGLEFRALEAREQEMLSDWVWERARRKNPSIPMPKNPKRAALKETLAGQPVLPFTSAASDASASTAIPAPIAAASLTTSPAKKDVPRSQPIISRELPRATPVIMSRADMPTMTGIQIPELMKSKAPAAAAVAHVVEGVPHDQNIHIEITPSPVKAVYGKLVGVVVDLTIAAIGVLIFFGLSWIVGNNEWNSTFAFVGLCAGLLFWAVYRFIYAFFGVETVGSHAHKRITQIEEKTIRVN
jgi:CheY-like chemotaxis protein